MGRKIKVRFNLGKGINYMKWKITYPDNKVEYYNPSDVQLVMTGCVFKNQKKTAQKIFDGGHKVVCAWILCDDIKILIYDEFKNTSERTSYNPRVQPNWLCKGLIMDDKTVEKLHTIDRGIYLTDAGN